MCRHDFVLKHLKVEFSRNVLLTQKFVIFHLFILISLLKFKKILISE